MHSKKGASLFSGRAAPSFLADEALCRFCRPAEQRPDHYQRLAHKARFHLRHAYNQRFDGLETYIFEPDAQSKGTVILVHGWGAEASFLAAIAEALRRAKIRAVLFDLPAHGRSEGISTNLAVCARATHRIASTFGPLEGFVGHSLGGLSALWAAEGGPPLYSRINVRKVALLACPNRFIDITRKFGAALKLGRTAQQGFERRLSRLARRPVEKFSAANLLKHFDGDVLLIHSTDDGEAQFSDAEIIAESGRATLIRCQGLGHSKLLYQPAIIRHIVDFFAETGR